ncbi:hypothetical protein [Roseivirga pacifica]|uniref:hypothetical protein n=1 Tax=Roseivirga pacifica TaxID=1267423 RepID=UPI0020946CBA|nr:hypothetical protein [Roseivirga pacifica]MCO6358349.1 hypothetical protein [Roseivirga pacifica]MCO6366187.1 hypothetical protein [Roseivirga pacifica]MCO6369262.1 hypothetical protein [Roseivirga pacifica]MCO6374080.1 hypothetical protein [Roseivirga pacifica]MCO6378456.1 hypothetical protein [Roseivirga pacifica]
MTSIKEQQKAISDKGRGYLKSWVDSISIKKGDGFGTVLLKLLKAVLGVLAIIILSPVLLLIVILTLAIAL